LLGPADEAILRALFTYHLLTAVQLCRLLYSPSSLRYVQQKLKVLTEHCSMVQKLFLTRHSERGSAPHVFTLSRKGLNHLASLGMDVEIRYRPSEAEAYSHLHLAHTLEVNDFLIAAELLPRSVPALELNEVRHERDLKRAPLRVADQSEKITTIPDAWLDFRLTASDEQLCLWVEVDRGTEEQRKFARKIKGIVLSLAGAYQDYVHSDVLTAVAIVTPSPTRSLALLRWTEPFWISSRNGTSPISFASPASHRCRPPPPTFSCPRGGIAHLDGERSTPRDNSA
jgi:hypothetical protein